MSTTAPALAAEPASASDFAAALLDPGPAHPIPPQHDLYAPLLGHWRARVTDHLGEGRTRSLEGEIVFARVLEGRAVQDLWIFPQRAARDAQAPREGNRYGTTLRVFDPARGIWNVDWFNPVTGVHTRLTGRRSGDTLLQEGFHADGTPIRWIFEEVSEQGFRWRGERSDDGGRSWILETEFSAWR
ncbi:hypothetical protein QFW77_15655 [Luteimonas sp. RD2P54]|uniref:DUF1579 domain-containing protein n=1 Tax=Luteimonas endophytica TaxID=3042023 RepID=A0ABT6JC50_9GAMM|nr:hypothetical protein [Luteimonas endophytica]MDH5824409.1 hypothetical protein [Luteimonas endophytica]